ncbi:hypothetical protein [Virgibacillus sp. SK37]|uniref:hypothetical protein n=1 Tax=Virgibacillus sp. SK37 TaxID=403957 RepID=UPI00119D6078|nr:hypothetical protein [Virgibacillus sp. SK37]
MSYDFWEWYKENKWDLFWYKYRVIMGLDPEGNSTWLQERKHWRKVEKIREKYDELDDPHRIFRIAHFLDLQPLLKKWWSKLDRSEKEKYLTEVWFKKMDGFFIRF